MKKRSKLIIAATLGAASFATFIYGNRVINPLIDYISQKSAENAWTSDENFREKFLATGFPEEHCRLETGIFSEENERKILTVNNYKIADERIVNSLLEDGVREGELKICFGKTPLMYDINFRGMSPEEFEKLPRYNTVSINHRVKMGFQKCVNLVDKNADGTLDEIVSYTQTDKFLPGRKTVEETIREIRSIEKINSDSEAVREYKALLELGSHKPNYPRQN